VDKDKKLPKLGPESGAPRGAERTVEMQELYRRLEPELRRSRPNSEAIAAALEAAQRLASQSDVEHAADDLASEFTRGDAACQACGHHSRDGSRFCAMCGSPLQASSGDSAFATDQPQSAFPLPGAREHEPVNRFPRNETHHYHHHYHHHYFPAGYEGGASRPATEMPRVDPAREDRLRPNVALRGEMSRAEAAVRRVTHEWVLACNTKHLDDLLELYAADAMVLRSNYAPVRGAAAIREFFFGALEAGLGEVEIEPLRVDVVGDLAYEAGRCKALVPGASGKRREERGKYLWVCARQGNGEWKVTADCWSSDLSLTMLESDIPPGAVVKTSQSRKS
jgi:uncharacterized protein (TIGR02246 family)